MNRFAFALCAISILGIGCSSGTKQEGKADKPSLQGMVTFICGPALLREGETQTTLDIGMRVPENATVETGSDATCEIQFAEYGSVHLSPDTKLTVSRLLRDGDHTEAEMNLAVGAVVCKVRKLSGDDRFNVRTQEMVAGVRGTVFLVSTDGSSSSRVAVTEGSVAVFPASTVTVPSEGTDAVASRAPSTLFGKIAASMPNLAAGEEVVVTKASVAEAGRILDVIYEEQSSAEVPSTEWSLPEAVVGKIEAAGNAMRAAGISGTSITPETQTYFDSAVYLDIRDLKMPPAESKDDSAADKNQTAKDGEKLVSLTVSVDPPDAIVSVNGAVLSRGAFRGLFGRDEAVGLAVTKEGYVDYRETVSFAGVDAVTRTVRLDAGSVSVESPSPEGLSVRAIPVSSSRIVALAYGSGSVIVASDAAGKVFALDADGKVLWSQPTGNGSNENSSAVVGSGVVAFAGDRFLVVFDVGSGAKLWQKPLGKGDSGLFGRRPAIAGSMLVMSSDGGIASFNAKTGNAGANFAISGGSDMSPCCSDGVLYIASKSGVFQAVEAASMAGKASVTTGAVQPVASAPAVFGKRAVFADRRGLVTAIDLDSMAVAWQSRLDSTKNAEIFSDPLVTADSICIMGKNVLYSLSLPDGTPRFAPVQGITTQPCGAKGYLWCGSGSKLLQIDSATGKTQADYPLPAVASGRPIFDGTALYIPLSDGSVGMINLETLKKS